MLNRIRKDIEPLTNSLALRLASTGISPNTWTLIGFICALIAGILYAYNAYIPYAYLYAGIALLASGFFDIVDGSVARVTKKVSSIGAFLDSTLDRISEVALFIGIIASNVMNPLLVALALSLSLLVSYSRARAEGIGVNLQGIGIGERAERLIILAVSSILASIISIELIQYGIVIIVILAGITFAHRVLSVFNAMARRSSSPPQP